MNTEESQAVDRVVLALFDGLAEAPQWLARVCFNESLRRLRRLQVVSRRRRLVEDEDAELWFRLHILDFCSLLIDGELPDYERPFGPIDLGHL